MREELNYCENCHVYVDNALDRCPLCGEHLSDSPTPNEMYAPVRPQTRGDRRSFYQDLLIFLTLVFVLGAVVINMLTWDGVPWFLAVATPILYMWILVKTCFSEYLFGTKVLLQLAGGMAGRFLRLCGRVDGMVAELGVSLPAHRGERAHRRLRLFV